MYFKKGLILILLIILMITPVHGEDVNNMNVPGVHFFQNYIYEKTTQGKSLFFFSQSEINSGHLGNITLFQSEITIRENFRGNIYAYFSTVYIEEGAVIDGEIFTVSSQIFVDKNTIALVEPAFNFLSPFINETTVDAYTVFNDQLHIVIIYLIIGLLREGACLVILSLKKGFIEQGSVLFAYEPMSLIQNGIMSYFIFLSFIVIFFASVVGFPLAVLIFIIVFFMVLAGQASLNVFVGNTLLEKLRIQSGVYANMVAGGVLLEIISFVPYIRFIVNFLFMPILCLGILTTNVVNGFLKRKYYEVEYGSSVQSKGKTDMGKIRDIVIKDLND